MRSFLRTTSCLFLTVTSPIFINQRSFALSIPRKMLVSTANSVADVFAVPMFQDNYGYFLVDRETGDALTVDPGDGQVIYQVSKENKFKLTTVLCTHKHGDHVGGNEYLQKNIPSLQFIATSFEPIPCATQLVGEGDIIRWGSLRIRVLNTFCHTAGHVVYVIDNESDSSKDPILFSGDTLFVGGCGRFFEGTAEQMLSNMDKLASLPGNTQVFCAHEYTESNFRFLNSLDSEMIGEKYQQIKELRAQGKPTIPSTIAEELRFNLFMQCRKSKIQEILGVTSPVDAMHELRTRKNNF